MRVRIVSTLSLGVLVPLADGAVAATTSRNPGRNVFFSALNHMGFLAATEYITLHHDAFDFPMHTFFPYYLQLPDFDDSDLPQMWVQWKQRVVLQE